MSEPDYSFKIFVCGTRDPDSESPWPEGFNDKTLTRVTGFRLPNLQEIIVGHGMKAGVEDMYEPHVMFLCRDGSLYAWGNAIADGDFDVSFNTGALGLGEDGPAFATIPQRVNIPPVAYVTCGFSETYAVTTDGRVFYWGTPYEKEPQSIIYEPRFTGIVNVNLHKLKTFGPHTYALPKKDEVRTQTALGMGRVRKATFKKGRTGLRSLPDDTLEEIFRLASEKQLPPTIYKILHMYDAASNQHSWSIERKELNIPTSQPIVDYCAAIFDGDLLQPSPHYALGVLTEDGLTYLHYKNITHGPYNQTLTNGRFISLYSCVNGIYALTNGARLFKMQVFGTFIHSQLQYKTTGLHLNTKQTSLYEDFYGDRENVYRQWHQGIFTDFMHPQGYRTSEPAFPNTIVDETFDLNMVKIGNSGSLFIIAIPKEDVRTRNALGMGRLRKATFKKGRTGLRSLPDDTLEEIFRLASEKQLDFLLV